MKNAPSTAEALIEGLTAYGVDTVFGIPGVHTLQLYDAMARSRIRHVGIRHEQGGVFMADGYARATGKPGVACLITGPGLLNAATAIGQAYSDSVPVLVLTTLNPMDGGGLSRGRLHEIGDQRAAIAPVARLVRTVHSPEEVDEVLAASFRHLTLERPRPIVLQVPLDVAERRGGHGALARKPASRPHPDPAQVRQAAELIASARLPVAVLGGGCVDVAEAALSFVEKSGCIVLTTTAGKGVLPQDHGCHVGSLLASPESHALLAEADVVVAIGTELAETDHWAGKLDIPGKIIRVDLDPDQLDRDYPAAIAMMADAAAVLPALTAALPAGRPWHTRRVAHIRKTHQDALKPIERKHAKVLTALREALPAEGMVFSDMTMIAYTGNMLFRTDHPRTWFHPAGFGTLGYALPAAIGAKLACPDRPVVALIGDGGIQFTLAELGTAREENLPLAVLLWNNRSLGQIALGMRQRNIQELAVHPFTPNFADIARAYDCRHIQPASTDELRDALAQAATATGPTIIEVFEDDAWLEAGCQPDS
ncbi:MAG TPA: 5-guanidino-2-oxopentanoate decarboxylase [Geminicoccus sp.]|uniref:5-guanidino-2-oxopentanoate decarboxylase n=1 Tax=Geminicoccus sp. TaxID=2024832 RepID=UPI002E3039C5|nr:5-guanidino-2-oxopentanoate decarboxylase [Geminicoccus sp.]HEX2527386.1 5-guanidino-2-oxopentanoate decarboxylase [Geminicoccus sp.]